MGNDRSAKTLPFVKSFLSVPSDGHHFARLVTTADNLLGLSQQIDIASHTDYLLLFDGRNENGPLAPMISVTAGNSVGGLKHRELTMQMAQTGWTRGGILFKTDENKIVVTVRNRGKSKH